MRNKSYANLPILLIDDQHTIRVLIRSVLQQLGYTNVHVAKDGAEGLSMARQVRPAVLLCDINMPDMNGLELARRIRTGGLTGVDRATRIVMLTGHVDAAVLAAALALDINGFVTKPVAPRNLADRLNRIFAMRSTVGPADSYQAIRVPKVTAFGQVGGSSFSLDWIHEVEEDQATETEYRLMPVETIAPGRQLGGYLRGRDGGPILPPGTLLTENLLIRLRDLKDVGLLNGDVPVAI